MGIYGFIPDKEWIQQNQERVFNYLKAKIEAEKLNPELDYEQDNLIHQLKEIAVADLTVMQRTELIRILDIDKSENE